MADNKKSPVMVHKVALVNNANLSTQFVPIPNTEVAEVRHEETGEIVTPYVPPKMIKQFEFCSKREMRAVRKARILKMRFPNAMLFAQREDGTHHPVSMKKRVPDFKIEPNYVSHNWLNVAKPGVPIEEQKPAMTLYRVAELRSDLFQKKA